MLNINKNKVLTLFALTLLLTSLLMVNLKMPMKVQAVSEETYLHGPSLSPIHMHSDIQLKPIHMHSTMGVLFPGDPRLLDPIGTLWHEVYPEYCNNWLLTSFEDVYPPEGLSPNDQIDMTNMQTAEIEWYHVDRMTITLRLSGPYQVPWHEPGPESLILEVKQPVYDPYVIYAPLGTMWHEVWPTYSNIYVLGIWFDDPMLPDGVLSFTDSVSFDGGLNWWHVEDVATDLILRWKMMDPIGTSWHELYPEYCVWRDLTSWEEHFADPYPGRLGPTDQIDMLDQYDVTTWYFVDRLTVTITVFNEATEETMMLELKTWELDEMYNWLKHPLGSLWHEVWPEYCPLYELTYYDMMDPTWDNCNGVLDPCDHIELTNTATGEIAVWHIIDMCYDMVLNEKLTDPVGTDWHELYPEYCNWYNVEQWTDITVLGFLSPSDHVSMSTAGYPAKEYQVGNMMVTVKLASWDEPGYMIYVEAGTEYDYLYWPKIYPTDVMWQEVYPLFGNQYYAITWEDNCNGVLDYCDNLTLQDPAGMPMGKWHVEEVTLDMVVNTLVHDVAITDVHSIYDWVYQGELDPIVVTVLNKGDFTETVDVFAYYDGNLAAPMQTVSLNPGESQDLIFYWDTTGVTLGFYQVSATASIVGYADDNPADNTLLGNTEEVRGQPTVPWFKKSPYPDYAPSGMPDFDEKQDQWGPGVFTWCGPVSVANSLWWLDSEYESIYNPTPIPPPTISDSFPLVTAYGPWDDHDPQNLGSLVVNLAFLMDADGMRTGIAHQGVSYLDMQTGISQYLQQQGVNPLGDCDGDGDVDPDDINIITLAFGSMPGMPNWDMRADIIIDNIVNSLDLMAATANVGQVGMFYEHTEEFPQFPWIEDEIYRCEDVVLFLEFWVEMGPGEWTPLYDNPSFETGHYVTCAGVNSTTFELLISDPWWDAAEAGFPGDVPVPHPVHADTTVHNDAQYVSHDAYPVFSWASPPMPPSPYGPAPVWELLNYLQQLGYPPNYHAFIRAAIVTSPLAEHDVAVTNVTTSKTGCLPKPTVGEGFNVNITVTVENQGSTTETFNVNVYANTTIIGTAPVTLNAGDNTTLTFVWDTTGFLKGNYTISATADTVPGETDTADNTFIDGLLGIVRQGDVNGDSFVNAKDAILLGTAFYPAGTYSPNADINNDGYCNAKDAIVIGTNFDV
jgi:hypothetical protein